MPCAKLAYKSGISQIYYRDKYRIDRGLQFLSKTKVKVDQLCGN